ncbi:hypothetical protein LZ009_05390 [Ramlibacter sp. XY19]|uniref:hypothetical protein n=1 Tax=Ramlibacter paludis TaxID=2908000 RepID=UPI0023D9CFB9|nr:hypothetical protein [Ramlibacter paludis]MCG2592210.1 hypothetical protein [Ramlibacter paludis]
MDIILPEKEVTMGKGPDEEKQEAAAAAVVKKPKAAKAALGVRRPTAKSKPRKRSGGAKAAGKTVTASKRSFPINGLEQALRIPTALKDFANGNAWPPADVANAMSMGLSTTFFYLTQSSVQYGLTAGTRDSKKIELTDLGRQIVYPKSVDEERSSLLRAFRCVELFAKVYDYYQGKNLPEIQYLKNTLKTEFGVAEEHQDQFYEVYQKNLTFLRSRQINLDIPKGPDGSGSARNNSITLGESTDASGAVAFVAMPFSERTDRYPKGYFDEVLKHLITPAAVKAKFTAKTAKKAGSEVIQSTIVNELDSADLVIVDLTEHNPNVLFELGMRIAFNKPVCLIRAKGTPPIFDIDHMLRVYDYDPNLWASTLEQDVPALSEHIAETFKNRDTARSYLAILREQKG